MPSPDPPSAFPAGPTAAPLGESQRRLLDHLKRRGESDLAGLEAPLGLGREALRQHLRALAALGLVESRAVRNGGPGRPRTLYRVAAAAHDLYPRREGEILRELVELLADQGGEKLLEQLFERRARRAKELHAGRLAGLTGIDRLRAVAAILSEQGFLAEVERDGAGRPRLRLCHCPWRELVAVSRVPCRVELALVEELLGTPLERESFLPAGDANCSYSPANAPRGGLVDLPTA